MTKPHTGSLIKFLRRNPEKLAEAASHGGTYKDGYAQCLLDLNEEVTKVDPLLLPFVALAIVQVRLKLGRMI